MTYALTLAETVFLVSFWKAVLFLLPFLAWAWLISTKLDKDAHRYFLNHVLWNSIYLGSGVLAAAAALFIPIFWIGWPISMLILAAPILVYWNLRNKAVPESMRFTLSSIDVKGQMDARRQARATRAAMIQFADPDGATTRVPEKDNPLLPTHVLAEDMLGPASTARASKVEILVGASGTTISQIVDGVRYKRPPVPAEAGAKLIDYLKGIARLDLADRRRRQSGRMQMKGPGGKTDLDLTTEGSSTGMRLTIEFDRARRLSRSFDDLGLLPAQVEAFRPLEQIGDRHGVVLFGAPAGQGLTTTGYSLISRHDAYTSNIKTLEREIVLRLDGVDHVAWDPNNPNLDFATNLQSMLRRDPDIMLIGEIMDSETANNAAGPGMKGPLLYIPQRAASVSEQIGLWARQVGDVKKASKALRIVMNQRLLRSLCPNCRQPFAPTPEQLKRLNLPAGRVKQLFKAGGQVQVKNKIEPCPVCAGTGYLGQVGVLEVLVLDDEARRMLAGNDLKGVLAYARRNKMILLQEAALAKVINGETTVEELIRVLSPKAGAESPPAAAAQPQPAA